MTLEKFTELKKKFKSRVSFLKENLYIDCPGFGPKVQLKSDESSQCSTFHSTLWLMENISENILIEYRYNS